MNKHRIRSLSPMVANQIAAGEVIERPASVVKELLENAWDSGADTFHIDIGFGGLNQVKVSDNGFGIDALDLPLAIAAHATSKMVQLNDLYALTSLGFRGEALASMASVSRLSISSKPKHQAHAMMLQVAGSASPTIIPCARTDGTTVEVLDLFFNAPVRKKFLKSAMREFQAIESVVKRFALSSPGVALTLTHEGKTILNLPMALDEKTRWVRVKKILGQSFAEQAIFLDVEHESVRLMGWVSGPNYQRSQSDKQWVYVNQRMMKDKLLNHAIKVAYGTLLHPGRHPACLLYFSLPPEFVDVNVHPTKHEVRFQDPRWVHDFISGGITKALEGSQEVAVRQSSSALKKQPLSVEPLMKDKSWVMLNARFAWVHLWDEPALVDMLIAHQAWLLSIFDGETYPLPSRPLLLPLRYTLDENNSWCERYQGPLMSLGICLDWVGKNEVVVRTLPLSLPQLDIQALLDHLNRPVLMDLSLRDWFNMLLSFQTFSLHDLTSEESQMLMDYLNQQGQGQPWCLPFGMKACLALFGEKVDA